ncbi:arsenate reductase/protein-tyrosine-phosphatase family protein [Siccibacter colletis]|uniref:protein-tyrosine-phosphatase n=1 Tax=Siccibacter colletis TaxID=1505757 RepID=A0ABY6JCR3_9ENTR|nr:hypothetical protein [Siccibacter colletis]UYU31616.1 protein tyrosine phosphatase [Siccibacter colletis]
MIRSVQVICIGNLCRSPVAALLLKQAVPALNVSSAGLEAVTGAPADDVMQSLAAEQGLDLSGHRATLFSLAQAAHYDLLLVMESSMRQRLLRADPTLCGKIKLFGQWLAGDREIADPYKKSREFNITIFQRIEDAAFTWKEIFCP